MLFKRLFPSMPLTSCAAAILLAAQPLQAAPAKDFTTLAIDEARELYATYNRYEIQLDPGTQPVDCRTLIVAADPSVPFRGTAVLLHGFSGCPQQYYEIAQILAKKGVQSFAPLLPGQGRAPVPVSPQIKTVKGQPAGAYYGEFLPRGITAAVERYAAFVREVNRFAASLPGPKLISGLSLGGGLATLAYLQQPGLYQRVLLTSPFYAPTTTDEPPADGQAPLSWGESCFKQNVGAPGRMPRRGICDFLVEHIQAIVALGSHVTDLVKALPEGAALPQVQYVFSEYDEVARTAAMRQTAAFQQLGRPPTQVTVCAYPNAVGHSFFSRPDLYLMTSDPYWLDSFLQMATDFLALGTEFKLDQATPSLEVAYDVRAGRDSQVHLKRCDIFPLQARRDLP